MFSELREYINAVEEMGECKVIEGADWDLEIGLITEWQASLPNSPLLLFDKIKGYEAGYRVASNLFATPKRTALALGLPLELGGIGLVRAWRDKLRDSFRLIPPIEVETGPVKENIHVGAQVDLFEFPTPKWHERDGGRYIGTAHAVITRDPDEGWVNLGTYRVQVHDKSVATIYMSPGRHGDIIRRKWWAKGMSCPAAVAIGLEPVLWGTSTFDVPWGRSEYEYAGGFAGKPVEVTRGLTTDLPIPATAEIVLEGEILETEMREEGPFGEWNGYYASGQRQEPIFRVSSILHRDNPIIHGAPPLFNPSAFTLGHHLRRAANVWNELDRHVPGVKGVWMLDYAGFQSMVIVSIAQKYGGHAKQAAMGILFATPTAYMIKYVIVVDEDIDPSNMTQVLWAIATRCEPAVSIDIVRGIRGSALDSTLPPDKKKRGEYTHSTAVILACKPFEWIKDFPQSIASRPELVERTRDKWGRFF